jgi:nucleotide-binding universal stress UspA family protein
MDDRSAQFSNITIGVDPSAPHAAARSWADELAGAMQADLRVVEFATARTGTDLIQASAGDDLLVVGSFRGKRGTTVGRMPERLAERTRVPVVVVPDAPRPIEGDVVLGADEPLDERAVAIAVSEAIRRRRRLTVLRAWEMPVMTRTGLTDFAEDPLRWRRINADLLQRATAEIAARFPEVRAHALLVEGRPGRAIVDHTRTASLVVLGQGHIHVLSGSVLHDVIRESHVPVCVVPASSAQTDADRADRAEEPDVEGGAEYDEGAERAS